MTIESSSKFLFWWVTPWYVCSLPDVLHTGGLEAPDSEEYPEVSNGQKVATVPRPADPHHSCKSCLQSTSPLGVLHAEQQHQAWGDIKC